MEDDNKEEVGIQDENKTKIKEFLSNMKEYLKSEMNKREYKDIGIPVEEIVRLTTVNVSPDKLLKLIENVLDEWEWGAYADVSATGEPYIGIYEKIKEEYWGINIEKIRTFQNELEKIKATHPEVGEKLFECWEEFLNMNIPIMRNGDSCELTTDTGMTVGYGRVLDKLRHVPMELMDYHLCEVERNSETM